MIARMNCDCRRCQLGASSATRGGAKRSEIRAVQRLGGLAIGLEGGTSDRTGCANGDRIGEGAAKGRTAGDLRCRMRPGALEETGTLEGQIDARGIPAARSCDSNSRQSKPAISSRGSRSPQYFQRAAAYCRQNSADRSMASPVSDIEQGDSDQGDVRQDSGL